MLLIVLLASGEPLAVLDNVFELFVLDGILGFLSAIEAEGGKSGGGEEFGVLLFIDCIMVLQVLLLLDPG